jgi:hypothetical protein
MKNFYSKSIREQTRIMKNTGKCIFVICYIITILSFLISII